MFTDDQSSAKLRTVASKGRDETPWRAMDIVELPTDLASTLANGTKRRPRGRRPIGPFNPFAASPKIKDAYIEVREDDPTDSPLDARICEVILLTVGSVWNSAYESYANPTVGKGSGLAQEALDALRAGRKVPGLSAKEDVARRFAHQLTSEHRIDDGLYAEARGVFGDRGLVDMAVLVGCNNDALSFPRRGK